MQGALAHTRVLLCAARQDAVPGLIGRMGAAECAVWGRVGWQRTSHAVSGVGHMRGLMGIKGGT